VSPHREYEYPGYIPPEGMQSQHEPRGPTCLGFVIAGLFGLGLFALFVIWFVLLRPHH
jgi:hypothetical protein